MFEILKLKCGDHLTEYSRKTLNFVEKIFFAMLVSSI